MHPACIAAEAWYVEAYVNGRRGEEVTYLLSFFPVVIL